MFHHSVIRRIRWVGLILIAGPFTGTVSRMVFSNFVAGQAAVAGHHIERGLDLDFSTPIIGLVVLVLAEVFKVGLQLQQEKELTI